MQVLHSFIKRDARYSNKDDVIENLSNALCSCLMSDEFVRMKNTAWNASQQRDSNAPGITQRA